MKVAVRVGVFVHTAAVAVCTVAVRLACAAGERLHAERKMKVRNIKKVLRCMVFGLAIRGMEARHVDWRPEAA